MPDDDLRFSRSGTSCPLGKCTEEAKTALPEEAKEKLTALAVLHDMSVAEYLRDHVILPHLYGHLQLIQLRNGVGRAGKGRENDVG